VGWRVRSWTCAGSPRGRAASWSRHCPPPNTRNSGRDATGVPVAEGMGDIVAISDAILVEVGGGHAIAAVIEEAADQDRGRVFDAYPSRSHIFGEPGLNRIEGGAINDGLVLAGMGHRDRPHRRGRSGS
jgi:hypothetical protein